MESLSECCGDGCCNIDGLAGTQRTRNAGSQSPAPTRTFFSAAVAQVEASSQTRDWGGKFLMKCK